MRQSSSLGYGRHKKTSTPVFALERFEMEQFNITMRKYLKEVGVTAQQAIERVVREEKLAGKGKLKVKMVLTGEGTSLKHVVEGEIDLSDANNI